MRMITTIEEAKATLAQDKSLMIRMDMDFHCWMQEGVRNVDNHLVAQGKKVALLSDEVFYALIPEMDQVFCSEYFQVA